jgi:hypothetical protein
VGNLAIRMVTRGKKIHVRQENPQSHTDSMIGDIKKLGQWPFNKERENGI